VIKLSHRTLRFDPVAVMRAVKKNGSPNARKQSPPDPINSATRRTMNPSGRRQRADDNSKHRLSRLAWRVENYERSEDGTGPPLEKDRRSVWTTERAAKPNSDCQINTGRVAESRSGWVAERFPIASRDALLSFAGWVANRFQFSKRSENLSFNHH
jgi:hypothetical protein